MGLCISGENDDYEGIVRYDGQKCLSFRHGEGTFLYQNGDMYKGQWKWNQKHGHGVYTHKNGEVKQGFFYHDEYIGKDPGQLFAVTTCSCFGGSSPSQPLMSEEEIRLVGTSAAGDWKGEKMRGRGGGGEVYVLARNHYRSVKKTHMKKHRGKLLLGEEKKIKTKNQERMEAQRQRAEEREKKREERQQRRDEVRKKYNL